MHTEHEDSFLERSVYNTIMRQLFMSTGMPASVNLHDVEVDEYFFLISNLTLFRNAFNKEDIKKTETFNVTLD